MLIIKAYINEKHIETVTIRRLNPLNSINKYLINENESLGIIKHNYIEDWKELAKKAFSRILKNAQKK